MVCVGFYLNRILQFLSGEFPFISGRTRHLQENKLADLSSRPQSQRMLYYQLNVNVTILYMILQVQYLQRRHYKFRELVYF